MKKKIISVVLIIAIVFGYIGLSRILSEGDNADYGLSKKGMVFSEEQEEITDTVISNEKYILEENEKYILEITNKANIQIASKTSDKVWKAIPDNDFGNSKYSSSLIMTYFADETTKKTLYSSQDAVNKNQYKIYKTDNGARVEYIFGEIASVEVYPDIISKDRLDMFLNKMNPEDKDYVLRRYQLYILDEYEENEKHYLISEYPRLKNEDIYVLKEISALHMKKKMDKIFRGVGYTEEDKQKDNGNFKTSIKNPESFKLAVKYELTEDGFKAALDLENTVFYNEYPIESIQILPYFDSYGKGEEGYFVMPSGSGALTYINGTKTKEEKIEMPVYGNNVALIPQNDIADNQCAFPMFGAYKENSGYICSFDSCGQQASINAEISQQYSSIYPTYTIIDNQIASLKSESILCFSATELAIDKIDAEYHLIENITYENAYSKMANIYRENLISEGYLVKNKISSAIPMVANIINTINYDTMAYGCFPVNKEFALTTFDEAFEIAEELSKLSDVGNLKVLLSGWNKKGLGAQKFDKATFSKIAGGEDALNRLQDKLSKKGIANYLDVEFNYVTPHLSDGFNSSAQAARDINNSVVNLEKYNPKKNSFEKTSIKIISPVQFVNVWDGFSKSGLFKDSGLGVGQFTQMLYSDYANGVLNSRTYSISQICKILEKSNKQNISVIGDGANIYALKYLNILNNVPIYSNNDNFFDKDIPFVQMVLHGYIDYASTSLNDLSVSQDEILKLIETGSGINYKLTMNSYEDIYETDYSYLYNTNYKANKTTISECYSKVSKALNGLNDKKIVFHSYLNDEVIKITYENGVVIILNYSDTDFQYENMLCESKNYLRIQS